MGMNVSIEGSNPSFSAGGVAERSNAAVSKTVIRFRADRGFKSLPLRCAEGLRANVAGAFVVPAKRCTACANPCRRSRLGGTTGVAAPPSWPDRQVLFEGGNDRGRACTPEGP